MNQLARIWASLSTVQRISLVVIPLVAAGLLWSLDRWKHDSDFRVLYSALTPEDAAAVTGKMREAGIEYRLDETGATVEVLSGKIADARLALAGAGMPRSGRIGFELFDRTNIGASDFAEQVNYRRALEGELERTVATLGEVAQARVHITPARDSVFLDSREPAKASVVLQLKRAMQLPQTSAFAIANLVASAVEGLSPEAVAIIDSNGRLLSRPRGADNDARMAEANLDYQRQIESELLAKVNMALEPLVGPGKFRAGVTVDCDYTSVEQNEESFDATRSAVLTSQSTEESSGATLAGGVPGTDSNLPRPTPRAGGGGSGNMRKTESMTYQPTRVVRRSVSPKGSIRRISTAVLLDQTARWEGSGAKARKVIVPPSAEVLKGVHDIVAGVTGFSVDRGDLITVETLPFESTVAAEPPAPMAAPKPMPPVDWKNPILIVGLAAVLMLAGVGFMIFRSAAVKADDTAPRGIERPEQAMAQTTGQPGTALMEAGQTAEGRAGETETHRARLEAETLSRIALPATTRKTEALIRHVQESVQKNSEATAAVLRAWITESEGGSRD